MGEGQGKPLIPALREQRQVDLCEPEGSLVYRVSSRTARTVTQRNPFSENKKKRKEKQSKKPRVLLSKTCDSKQICEGANTLSSARGRSKPFKAGMGTKSQVGNCLRVCVCVCVRVHAHEWEYSLSVFCLFLNGLLRLVRWFSHYEHLLLFQRTPPEFHFQPLHGWLIPPCRSHTRGIWRL